MYRKALFICILICMIFLLGCPRKKSRSKERISKNDSPPASAFYDLGIFAGQTGKLNVAINYFKKAVKLRPRYSDAYGDMGLAYYKLERFAEAEAMFKKAIDIDPGNASALMNYGLMMLKDRRYTEGQELLESAVRAKPAFADALYNLAHLYEKLGKYNDAIYAYKRMIDVKPGVGGLHYQLAMVYLKKEMYSDALDHFVLASENSPEQYNAFYQSAVIYHMKRELPDAVRAYKEALKLKTSHIDSYINLGDIYLLELNDVKNALIYYKTALAVYPENTYARKRLKEIDEGEYDGLEKIELDLGEESEKTEDEEEKKQGKYPSLESEYIEIKPVKSDEAPPSRIEVPDEPGKGKHLQFENAEELKKLLRSEGIK